MPKVPFWWKNLVNKQGDEENQETEEKQEEHEVSEINPEYEEKPIVEASQEISEDFHGGEELTFSMESEAESEETDNTSEDEGSEINSENGDSGNEGSESEGSVEESGETENSNDDSDVTDTENGSEESEGSDGSREYSGEREVNKSVFLEETATDRKLKTVFQRFIERIAEVETKYEVFGDPEKLSVKQLLKRTLNKKPLSACYMQRLKEQVILLVDTSGSMDWWAEILQKMTALALKFKDIEIYEAPNGLVTRPVKSFESLNEYYDWSEYEVFHEEFVRRTKNRVIIYIGDFDGADTPYELALRNDVYWICNEDRYEDTLDHSWCSHSLSDYPKNCRILWAYDEDGLVKVFQGISTEQRLYEYEEDDYYD
jgi:hypothetical protein